MVEKAQSAAARQQQLMAMHFPTVSLARALTGGGVARRLEAATLAEACKTTGFFFLVDHGIPQRTWDGLFPAARRLFELPAEAKGEIHYSRARVWPGTTGLPVRGYLRPDEERLGPLPSNRPDMKEAWDMADDLPPGGEAAPYHGPNLWPSTIAPALFREPVSEYHAAIKAVAAELRALVCEALEWPAHALDGEYKDDTHVMRLLHYPPRPPQLEADFAQPCAAHTDQGCFTLLKQDASGGLQAKHRESGTWVDVPARTDVLTVNVGDTLCAWTGGAFRSTVHRVVPASGGAARLSCGFFADPSAKTALLDDSASDHGLYNDGIVNLLHKAGLPQNRDGVAHLRALSFSEYKHAVFTKFRPDARPHVRVDAASA